MKYYRPEIVTLAKRSRLYCVNAKKPIHESIAFVIKDITLTPEDRSDILDLIINWEVDEINEKHKNGRLKWN